MWTYCMYIFWLCSDQGELRHWPNGSVNEWREKNVPDEVQEVMDLFMFFHKMNIKQNMSSSNTINQENFYQYGLETSSFLIYV